jgi:glycerol-3-phosphate dehydrogenase (NAD(P)+)
MRVSVLGGGSWGTALAVHVAGAGHETTLWARSAAAAAAIESSRENPDYLPGVRLPPLLATADLERAVTGADVVVLAVPSGSFRDVCRQVRGLAPAGATFVSATKGLEGASLKRMTEVGREEVEGAAWACLSGPSFALEVAGGEPTAVVVASADVAVAEAVQQAVSTPSFRAYASDDTVGVELSGALKNVIAIAAGVLAGLGFGHNPLAALVTRGLAEMGRLVVCLGGRAETVAGLAGLGDLVLTCTGSLSRNRRLGMALGRGRDLLRATAEVRQVAEGVPAARAACALAAREGIEMPIAAQMSAVLFEGLAAREAVARLMLRQLKRE